MHLEKQQVTHSHTMPSINLLHVPRHEEKAQARSAQANTHEDFQGGRDMWMVTPGHDAWQLKGVRARRVQQV